MPTPAETAISALKPKATVRKSSEIRAYWSEAIRRQSLFSAQTTKKAYLDEVRRRLVEVANRAEIPLVAEKRLKATLAKMGYTPQGGFKGEAAHWHGKVAPPAQPGSITDLSSSRRLQLIIDVNVRQARSMGQLASSDDPVFLMANPAWRLERTGARREPRGDWAERWLAAGDEVGWTGAVRGEMVALKSSPIWRALGDGAGGFRDTLGSPYPPFAFGSGLGWTNVGRREARRLGLDVESVKPSADAARAWLERPVGAEFPTGAQAVSASGAGGASVSSPQPPAPPPFVPDFGRRDAAIAAIGEAAARVDGCRIAATDAQTRLAAARDAARETLAKWPEIDPAAFLARLEAAVAGMGAVAEGFSGDVAAVKVMEGRVRSVPAPSDIAGQAAYDAGCAAVEGQARAMAQAAADKKMPKVRDALALAGSAPKEAERMVRDWISAETAKAEADGHKAMDGMEAVYAEMQGRVNAARARLKEVRKGRE